MITCYLAGPIDYEKDKGVTWKQELMDLCENNNNIGFFDPFTAFKFNKVDQEMAVYVHDVNMMALEKSDILVGRLMRGQASVGTPIEFYHMMNRKHMLIMTDMADSVYMQYIGTQATFVNNINNLYGKLLKLVSTIEDGRNKMLTKQDDNMMSEFRRLDSINSNNLVGVSNG